MIPPEWLEQAAHRLQSHIRKTPLTYDPDLNLFLKWENRQPTGSFKIRGVANKVLALEPWEQQRGLEAHTLICQADISQLSARGVTR